MVGQTMVKGRVEQISGSGHARVSCEDGYVRVCRLRFRGRIRAGDTVIVRPWSVQSNEKGDIISRERRG